ncbi:GntR family transcriptional regulator [Micromonospora rubida]|uniref:GntR family transcriptional regulator n=1 Tax=Micromonospora rubida TaxID=2697657 RepID=UPI001378D4B7|nr:GntR family transcriptional regulator [Micromonospora rubida]NBE80877.1 GntR family transcriptional regulator [Micromonospora rubida]
MPTPHYGQPRYRVIADELRKRIESGAIPPGALLPAESMLTAEFRASRGTIRQAIAVLREDGVATTEHGRGTYANAYTYDHSPDRSSDLETRQREVAANAELAALFGVEVGAALIERESVRRNGTTVVTVVRAYRPRTTGH